MNDQPGVQAGDFNAEKTEYQLVRMPNDMTNGGSFFGTDSSLNGKSSNHESLSSGGRLNSAQREAILAQLERLLSSRFFSQSRRYPALLRFIVLHTLHEETEMLRERLIGHHVFQRSPDYDTNADPVVRTSAAEVRKRIAQYYHELGNQPEPVIELRSGSYVPTFTFPEQPSAESAEPPFRISEVPAIEDVGEEVEPVPAEAPVSKVPAATLRPARIALYSVIGVLVITAIAGFLMRKRPSAKSTSSALDEIWAPILENNRNTLICLGESSMFDSTGKALDLPPKNPDNDSLLEAFADKRDFVPFPDVQAFGRLSTFLGTRNHAFDVQSSPTTVYSQLRQGPVLLIGAFNNQWTLNRSTTLRFRFGGPDGPGNSAWIEDTQRPQKMRWQISSEDPRSKVQEDYAIVARYADDGTGQVVMIAAGLAGSGTKSAGEFLTDEQSLEQLLSSAPAGWGHKNFEAVIGSQVIDGMPGRPKIMATAFW